MSPQIKSKKRVADFGEVFTSPREVRAMLDLVKGETLRIDSRFLEPACGDGAFLSEILTRKLSEVTRKYKSNPIDWERQSILAVSSVYGVDILEDNAEKCRENLFALWDAEYSAHCTRPARIACYSEDTRRAVRFILSRNIVCGNALTLMKVDSEGRDTDEPIVFSEWSFVTGNIMQRNDYTFAELLADGGARGRGGAKSADARGSAAPHGAQGSGADDGGAMREVSAGEILDLVTSNTSAVLLARRWQSALLVNVDNDTLRRLMANEKAMAALMSIEGFRSLNDDIEVIISKSEHVKKTKKEGVKSEKEKRELTEEEKEFKSRRKMIQEKLIKFATRIPVFMYLTDYREQTLKDVITALEPELFRKVTGLTVDDFDMLCHLNVFNASRMNEAVWQFRRYEDSSLSYTGINRHEHDKEVGGFDASLRMKNYREHFYGEIAAVEEPGA